MISIYEWVQEEGEEVREKLVLEGEGEFQDGMSRFWVRTSSPTEIVVGGPYYYRVDQSIGTGQEATECQYLGYGNGVFRFYVPSVEARHQSGGVDLKVEVPTTLESNPPSLDREHERRPQESSTTTN